MARCTFINYAVFRRSVGRATRHLSRRSLQKARWRNRTYACPRDSHDPSGASSLLMKFRSGTRRAETRRDEIDGGFRKSKEESETRESRGTWAQRKNYLLHSSRRLSRDNAHSNAPCVPISGPPSSRYLCAPHARVSRLPPRRRATHAARHEKLYYEVNRGECGRNSRFGYARWNVVLRKQRGNGTRCARMQKEISRHLILLLVDLRQFFLSNGKIL